MYSGEISSPRAPGDAVRRRAAPAPPARGREPRARAHGGARAPRRDVAGPRRAARAVLGGASSSASRRARGERRGRDHRQDAGEQRAARDAIAAGIDTATGRRLRAGAHANPPHVRRGPARGHHLPELPPVRPCHRGGTDQEVGGAHRWRTATTAARSWSPDGGRSAHLLRRWRGATRDRPRSGRSCTTASASPPQRLATVSERIGETTNNVAEYRALIAGLRAAEGIPARPGCTLTPQPGRPSQRAAPDRSTARAQPRAQTRSASQQAASTSQSAVFKVTSANTRVSATTCSSAKVSHGTMPIRSGRPEWPCVTRVTIATSIGGGADGKRIRRAAEHERAVEFQHQALHRKQRESDRQPQERRVQHRQQSGLHALPRLPRSQWPSSTIVIGISASHSRSKRCAISRPRWTIDSVASSSRLHAGLKVW